MSFISFAFLLFVFIVVLFYYILPSRLQWMWLLATSLIFYIMAVNGLIVFILCSILSTYLSCLGMGYLEQKQSGRSRKHEVNKKRKKSSKRVLLIVTLVFNTGILVVLKYTGFLTGIFGVEYTMPIILPLGISFYTLSVMGYCIDVYRAKYAPERNIAKYALFVLYYPQIVQGPIARYDQLAPQLTQEHHFDFAQVKMGFQLMLWGYFKKMVIADRANMLVSNVFDNYENYGGFQIYIAAVFYAMQLYADFSGCVDIARGTAQMLGIDLAENFKHPYFSQSMQDFWKRWHISLSSWFRDYLYIPLGGNRKGQIRKYINILLVFLVSGLWHGAGLTFLVWGLLHGMYQIVGALLMPLRNRIVNILAVDRSRFSHRLFKGIVTFHLVSLAWIFFRADTLQQAVQMVRYMMTYFNPWIFLDDSIYMLGLDMKDFHLTILGFVIILIVSLLQQKRSLRKELGKQSAGFQFFITALAVLSILFLGIYGPGYDAANFIYANF